MPIQKKHTNKRRMRINAEINITPFVDVILVLLVIFMVTAPLMKVGVPINLPKEKARILNEKQEPVTISINGKGEIFIQDTIVEIQQLSLKIKAILTAKPNTPVFIKADKNLYYGKVINIMNQLNSVGINKIALMTEIPSRHR